MFVSVFKATPHATGKLIVSSSNGLFHWTALYRYIYGNRVEQAHHRCHYNLLYTLQSEQHVSVLQNINSSQR